MKKKIIKYIRVSMTAVLLLTSVAMQISASADINMNQVISEESAEDLADNAEKGMAISGDEADGIVFQEESADIEEQANDGLDGQEDITDKFTDSNFRSAVREILGLDNNGRIKRFACAKISGLDVRCNGIQSLNGIEYFTNLKSIDCSDNELTSLDLSACLALKSLDCSGNGLASLDVSACRVLESLDCQENGMTSLDVTSCRALESLECRNNGLTSLDLSSCSALLHLYCSENQLTSLDVSACRVLKSLGCSDNGLTSLDISSCPDLESLSFGNNKLTSLDLSYSQSLTGLYCEKNRLTNLNVSCCPALKSLDCANNQLTSLDVSSCPALYNLDCSDNGLISLDVSSCSALDTLWCRWNKLTNLDVTSCLALRTLNCWGNELTSLDVTSCPALSDLNCTGNGLTSLDVTSCPVLVVLDCNGNGLTNLDLSVCPALKYLDCNSNKLTSLDVTFCPALIRLECDGNELTSLDTSYCPALEYLDCGNNQLTSLDVSSCPTLGELHCVCNKLANLDVSSCVALHDLICTYNELTSLDVSDCFSLTMLDCSHNHIKNSSDVKGLTKEWDDDNFIFSPQDISKKAQKMTVTPSSLVLYAGRTTTPLKVSNAIGEIIYKSSDTKIVKVDTKGKVTPVSKGTAIITITAAGDDQYVPASVNVKVTVNRMSQKMTVTPSSLVLYVGGEAKTLNVLYAKGKVTYKPSNAKVVKVDVKGKVTPVSKGTATIAVTAAGNGQYEPKSVKVKVTVDGKLSKVSGVKVFPAKTKGSLKVSWKKVSSASGYVIRYSYSKNMKGSNTIQINKNSNVSAVLKKLKPKKYIYVQVQAYKKDGHAQIKGAWSNIAKSSAKVK